MRNYVMTVIVCGFTAINCPAQIMIGQIDNFQDSTTQNWVANGLNPVPPTNIATGGPAGAGDRYLQINTTGSASGPGSRLAAFNLNQWVGDYSTNGVAAISVDLRNFNVPTPLSVRLAFKQGSGNSVPAYLSQPFSLANDGQWHNAVFPLLPGQFTALNSPGSFAQVMNGTFSEFWIIHTVGAELFGDSTVPIAAQLGIDNITAVPEPTSMALLGLAAAGWTIRRRKNSK